MKRHRDPLPRNRERAQTDSPAISQSPLNAVQVSTTALLPRYRPLATSSKHTSTDCVSSTALMVFRGVGAGIAWTIGVDLYALVGASDAAWREHLATRPSTATKSSEFARLLVRSCGRNVLLFGGFLTVFGGLTCSMEMVRGRHDFLNPFVGGFASGLMVMPRDLYRTPKMLLGGAALCGASAMALYQLVPASSEGTVDHDDEHRRRQTTTL